MGVRCNHESVTFWLRERREWLRGHKTLYSSLSFTFYTSSGPPRFPFISLFLRLYFFILIGTVPFCSRQPIILLLLFVLFFTSPTSSLSTLVTPLSLPPAPFSADSGSISSASGVVLLSQWPITQSHWLSSGMDGISSI